MTISQKIIGVMACDPNGIIGKNGKLPWSYPDEYQHFLDTIKQSPIILGRKSFEDCPEALIQNRTIIVFSKNKKLNLGNNIHVLSSLEEFAQLNIQDPLLYMIGGGEIAKIFLESGLLSEFILTIINKEYEGDAFFPLELIEKHERNILKSTKDYIIYKYNLS